MYKSILLLVLFTVYSFAVNAQKDYQSEIVECNKLKYSESQECMIGKKIFDFKGTNYAGEMIDFSAFQGKVIIINFWFMACVPCIAEMKGLNEIVDKYKTKEVKFISFTWDGKKELEQYFFPKYNFKFEIISDAESFLAEDIKLRWGFPTTYIIDQNGIIRKIFSGGETEEEIAIKEIKEKIIPVVDQLLLK